MEIVGADIIVPRNLELDLERAQLEKDDDNEGEDEYLSNCASTSLRGLQVLLLVVWAAAFVLWFPAAIKLALPLPRAEWLPSLSLPPQLANPPMALLPISTGAALLLLAVLVVPRLTTSVGEALLICLTTTIAALAAIMVSSAAAMSSLASCVATTLVACTMLAASTTGYVPAPEQEAISAASSVKRRRLLYLASYDVYFTPGRVQYDSPLLGEWPVRSDAADDIAASQQEAERRTGLTCLPRCLRAPAIVACHGVQVLCGVCGALLLLLLLSHWPSGSGTLGIILMIAGVGMLVDTVGVYVDLRAVIGPEVVASACLAFAFDRAREHLATLSARLGTAVEGMIDACDYGVFLLRRAAFLRLWPSVPGVKWQEAVAGWYEAAAGWHFAGRGRGDEIDGAWAGWSSWCATRLAAACAVAGGLARQSPLHAALVIVHVAVAIHALDTLDSAIFSGRDDNGGAEIREVSNEIREVSFERASGSDFDGTLEPLSSDGVAKQSLPPQAGVDSYLYLWGRTLATVAAVSAVATVVASTDAVRRIVRHDAWRERQQRIRQWRDDALFLRRLPHRPHLRRWVRAALAGRSEPLARFTEIGVAPAMERAGQITAGGRWTSDANPAHVYPATSAGYLMTGLHATRERHESAWPGSGVWWPHLVPSEWKHELRLPTLWVHPLLAAEADRLIDETRRLAVEQAQARAAVYEAAEVQAWSPLLAHAPLGGDGGAAAPAVAIDLAQCVALFKAGAARASRPTDGNGLEQRLTPRSTRLKSRAALRHRRLGPRFAPPMWRPMQRVEDVWPNCHSHTAAQIEASISSRQQAEAALNAERQAAVERAQLQAARYEAGEALLFVDYPYLERVRAAGGTGLDDQSFADPRPIGADLDGLGEAASPETGFHWALQIQLLTDLGALPAAQVWKKPQPAVALALQRAARFNARKFLEHNEAVRAKALERSRQRNAEYEKADASGVSFVDWTKVDVPPDIDYGAADAVEDSGDEDEERFQLLMGYA